MDKLKFQFDIDEILIIITALQNKKFETPEHEAEDNLIDNIWKQIGGRV